MKLVIASKFFFPNGGTEIYLKLLLEEMPRQGHQCLPFAVGYKDSWESPYAKYFLPPPAGEAAPRLEMMRLSPGRMLTLLERSVYSFAARKCLDRLLDGEGPVDAALAINIYNYMSPSIFDSLAARGVPIALFLGDYHLMCANYQFLRQDAPCFLCQKGAYWHGLAHRCVKGSLAASAVRVASMYVQRLLGLWKLVDVFIAPCLFMRDRLAEAGFPKDRLAVLRYPIPAPELPPDRTKGNYILYFGRVSREKGLDVLIDAYQESGVDADLVILGRDYDGEQARLTARIRPQFAARIRFPGFASGEALERWIGQALLCLAPSRWHDNAPLSIYEAQVRGTPVLASAMGGIPEQITPGEDGDLFANGDVAGLAAKLRALLADKDRLGAMGQAGRERVIRDNDPAAHVRELVALLSSLPRQSRRQSR